MNISNIALYVDGPTEEGALKAKFCKDYNGKHPKFKYGPGNGIKYTIQTYAKNVAPKIILDINRDIHIVMIIIDLEKREIKTGATYDSFALELKDAIINEVSNKGKYCKDKLRNVIYVCPSNIMFENWIVCDIEGIKSNTLIKDDNTQEMYDGSNGAYILGSLMTVKYKKTVHAKLLHKLVDSTRGMQHSPSYANFINTITSLISDN